MAVTLPASAVLDTGALIAITNVAMGRSTAPLPRALLARMNDRREPMRVFAPTVVIAEWWRGEDGPAARVRDAVTALDTPKAAALEAGLLLAAMPDRPKSTKELLVVDAMVIIVAAHRACDVFTSDVDDLAELRDKLLETGRHLAAGSMRIYPV